MAIRGSQEWRERIRAGHVKTRAAGTGNWTIADPSKRAEKTCPYCGTQFSVYLTRPRLTCGKPECSHKARSAAASRTGKRSWASGQRIVIVRDPTIRARISKSLKRAYREGRAIPPSTRPGVGAKISATKLANPTVLSLEIRQAIGRTLREKYRLGILKRQPGPAELRLGGVLELMGFVHQAKVLNPTRPSGGSGGAMVYRPDFAHPDKKVIIEVDGREHRKLLIQAKDRRQEAVFRAHGFRVLRVSDKDVLKNLPAVVERIKQFMDEPAPP